MDGVSAVDRAGVAVVASFPSSVVPRSFCLVCPFEISPVVILSAPIVVASESSGSVVDSSLLLGCTENPERFTLVN